LIAYIPIKYFLSFPCEIAIFITFIYMECFSTFSFGITIYIAFIPMECLAIFIAYILILYFLTFPYGITIYIAFILMECLAIFIAYIPMQCFLTFFIWNNYIYSLHPHAMFLNFFMRDIKTSNIYIFNFFRVDSCWPFGRVNPRVRFNNYANSWHLVLDAWWDQVVGDWHL